MTVGVVLSSAIIIKPRKLETAVPIPKIAACLDLLIIDKDRAAITNARPKTMKGQPSNGGNPGPKGHPSSLFAADVMSWSDEADKRSAFSKPRTPWVAVMR